MTTLLATREPDLARRFDRALAARHPCREIGRYELFTCISDADGYSQHLAVARGYLAALRQHGCAPAQGGPVFLRHYRIDEPEIVIREILPYFREHLDGLNRLSEMDSLSSCVEEHFDIGALDDGLFLTSRYYFGVDLSLLAAWCRSNNRNLPWSVGAALFQVGSDAVARVHSLGWSGPITARRIRICLSGASSAIVIGRPLVDIAAGRLVPPPALNSRQDLANLASAIAHILPIPVAELESTSTWSEDRSLVEQLLARMDPIPSSLPLLRALVGDANDCEQPATSPTHEEVAYLWAAVKSASPDMHLLAQ